MKRIEDFMTGVIKRNPGDRIHQAVREVVESVMPT